jgi:predicted nucleotidyltransferase
MNSITINSIIPAIQGYFATQPITKAWLFGSYSRGEETVGSDVDILVSFDKDAKISLFKYADIICQLEALLKQKVDLVEEGTLLPFAQRTANEDKILIYERGN